MKESGTRELDLRCDYCLDKGFVYPSDFGRHYFNGFEVAKSNSDKKHPCHKCNAKDKLELEDNEIWEA